MGTKNNPSKFDCYDNALPDEPMFVLLARDPSAPHLLQVWANERDLAIRRGERPTTDWAMVEEALKCARDMRVWRRDNEGRWRDEPRQVTRYLHLKRQSTYRRMTGECSLQLSTEPPLKEGAVLTIYRSEIDGAWYARPTGEFNDGRFAPVEEA